MSHAYYMHWLLLVKSVHLWDETNISREQIDEANLCILKFIDGVEKLYGIEHVSFNVHLLSHLSKSVLNHGPLWASSAFVFEAVNRQLLTMFHGTQRVPYKW